MKDKLEGVMKDKLESVYKEFISEKDKEQFLRLLNDSEAWLYEEGDDETKTVYNKKLEELKKHGDPIFKRVKEFEDRSAAFDHLGVVVMMRSSHSTKQGMKNWLTFLQRRCRKLKKLYIQSSSGCTSNFRNLRTFLKVPTLP